MSSRPRAVSLPRFFPSTSHDFANLFLEPSEEPSPGCVILFAQSPGGVPVHAGLMGEAGRFIHAHWTAGIVENRYGNWFKARTTHVFDWPDSNALTQSVDKKGRS